MFWSVDPIAVPSAANTIAISHERVQRHGARLYGRKPAIMQTIRIKP